VRIERQLQGGVSILASELHHDQRGYLMEDAASPPFTSAEMLS